MEEEKRDSELRRAAGLAAAAVTRGAAGAAREVLRDPAGTLQAAAGMLKTAAVSGCVLLAVFLYALPTSVYEGVEESMDTVETRWETVLETWRQEAYGGYDYASDRVSASFHAVPGLLKAVWHTACARFGPEETGETLTESGSEAEVTWSEDAQRQTLREKRRACADKLNRRMEELGDAVRNSQPALDACFYEQFLAGAYPKKPGIEYRYRPARISVVEESVPETAALELLSLYTVQTGGSLSAVRLSELMRWLGYRDSSAEAGRVYFTLGENGPECSVPAWQGTYLPEYLCQTRTQELNALRLEVPDAAERNRRREEIDRYYRQWSAPAVDLLLVVEAPDPADTQPIVIYEKNEETGQETGTVQWQITVRIGCRSVETLSRMSGLWEGSLNSAQHPEQLEDGIGSFALPLDTHTEADVSFLQGELSWPLPGCTRITSRYGWRICPYHGRELHPGVDIAAAAGTRILAAGEGTVLISAYHSSLGNYVRIRHLNGSETQYCHMSRRLCSAGDRIAAGQCIGLVGSTGTSTGAHLDFRMYQRGTAVNPLSVVTPH